MSLERATWTVVVAICLVGALLLGVGGYSGYSLTAIAVGLAAAVNLLPRP